MVEEPDSPFARVPAANAGPGPLQAGPFTYERMVASTGRGSVDGVPRWQRWALIAMFVAFAALAAALLVARSVG